MAKYGVPYMGSKSTLAPWVVENLPAGPCLVDLFAGGCAVTHAALLSGKWKHILANDITNVPKLFIDAIHGRYRNERRWISREYFEKMKHKDPYVGVCWAFGNQYGKSYLYSSEIEPYKRALHYAVVFDEWGDLARLCPEVADGTKEALKGMEDRKQRRLTIGRAILAELNRRGGVAFAAKIGNPLYNAIRLKSGGTIKQMAVLESLESLERLRVLQSLESLESLERLQSLESLECLECLHRSQLDYRAVELPPGAVVYCDPPYEGTTGYNGEAFDNAAFWQWVRDCGELCVVSEFAAPPDFVCVAGKKKLNRINNLRSTACLERLFVHEARRAEYNTRMGLLF